MKIYFDLHWNSHGSHRCANIIVAIICLKKSDLPFYVLYQLNHDTIHKMSTNTMEIYFLIFWATTWHWQSKFETRPSYWYQFHFSRLFPDFWGIWKFSDTYQNLSAIYMIKNISCDIRTLWLFWYSLVDDFTTNEKKVSITWWTHSMRRLAF